MTLNLEETEKRLGCLVPKPGVEMPSCHEFTLCDCEALALIARIRELEAAQATWGNEFSAVCMAKQERDAPTMTETTAFHNRIWEAISEAFRRGQRVTTNVSR